MPKLLAIASFFPMGTKREDIKEENIRAQVLWADDQETLYCMVDAFRKTVIIVEVEYYHRYGGEYVKGA